MSALLRAFVLVALLASPALAADKTNAHGGKGANVSPVCAASKKAWANQSACDKFKAGICSTVETCPNLCSYLTSAEGCDLVTKAAFNAYNTPIFGEITAVVKNDNSCVATVDSGVGVEVSCAFAENGIGIKISCPAGYYSAQIMCDWPAGSSIYTPAAAKEKAYCRFPSFIGVPREYKGYVTCMKTGGI